MLGPWIRTVDRVEGFRARLVFVNLEGRITFVKIPVTRILNCNPGKRTGIRAVGPKTRIGRVTLTFVLIKTKDHRC